MLTSVTAAVALLDAPLSLLDGTGLIGVPVMYWGWLCPSRFAVPPDTTPREGGAT
jgi:hypothetical protein